MAMTRKAEGKGATAMCSHFDQIHRLTRPFAISSIPQHRKTKIALKQRNFDPVTRQPAQHAAGGSGEDLLDGDDQETTAAGETVEKRMEGIAERIVQEDEAKRTQELVSDPSRSRIQLQRRSRLNHFHAVQDLLNIQPKRANWDLKRDMDKRMRKMDRKTQEAYEYLFRK